MSLGVAFALTEEQAADLLSLEDDESREEWLQELEEDVDDDAWIQYDKAWEELHRCLGDGELLIQDGPPLAQAVFGSHAVMQDEETATFAGLLEAAEVPAVAAALREVERGWLRERFEARLGRPLDRELFEHVWSTLEDLREFYARLEGRKAAMVFSVDA